MATQSKTSAFISWQLDPFCVLESQGIVVGIEGNILIGIDTTTNKKLWEWDPQALFLPKQVALLKQVAVFKERWVAVLLHRATNKRLPLTESSVNIFDESSVNILEAKTGIQVSRIVVPGSHYFTKFSISGSKVAFLEEDYRFTYAYYDLVVVLDLDDPFAITQVEMPSSGKQRKVTVCNDGTVLLCEYNWTYDTPWPMGWRWRELSPDGGFTILREINYPNQKSFLDAPFFGAKQNSIESVWNLADRVLMCVRESENFSQRCRGEGKLRMLLFDLPTQTLINHCYVEPTSSPHGDRCCRLSEDLDHRTSSFWTLAPVLRNGPWKLKKVSYCNEKQKLSIIDNHHKRKLQTGGNENLLTKRKRKRTNVSKTESLL